MMKSFISTLCCLGLATGAFVAGPAIAGEPLALPATAAATSAATATGSVTVRELAGTWIEPVTNSGDSELEVSGSETVVEIASDGTFSDESSITFRFRDYPAFNGTYSTTGRGRVSITNGAITWVTESAQAAPVFPANVSDEKRDAMREFADRLAKGMIGTETYPIVSYDGRELVMDAGDGGSFDQYVMTRR